MNRAGCDCFAVGVRTCQGHLLGVGGLCLPGRADYWKEQMAALRNLRIDTHDIYEIDCELAAAISERSDKTLLIAGATLNTGDQFPAGIRTGGVLGDPNSTPLSANGTVECLHSGFYQCAKPGGPGVVVRSTAESAAVLLKKVCALKDKPAKAAFLRLMDDFAGCAGMLVFDGTGEDAHGWLLAYGNGHCEYVDLMEIEHGYT